MMIRTLAVALATTSSIMAFATPAAAQTRQYDIPAGSLKGALDAYARQSGRQLVYRGDEVRSAKSGGARGDMSADAALAKLLAGSGFTTRTDGKLIAIVKVGNGDSASASADADTVADENEEILVTGTRIRGARVISPVIVRTQQDAREQGQNTLTDIIRSIPQNFGGGTNPGVNSGNVPENRGTAYGGGAALNLRGLGSDATLTLLNGHRLTYGVVNQGVDISAIPLLALDRIEVVADGSSALYGSDAVAGVANVILKRAYDGIATNSRFSASTDGGNEQQQYGGIAGAKWASGGFFAAYEFERDTPIEARQRGYAAERAKGLDLYPAQKRHSVVVAGHQEIVPGVTFAVDALYNQRFTRTRMPYSAAGDYRVFGLDYRYDTETLSIAPSLTVDLGGGWSGSVVGAYGRERLKYRIDLVQNQIPTTTANACFCNDAKSTELAADGPLFPLPGGTARLAVGTGFRSNGFDRRSKIDPGQTVVANQDVYYGFGEISLPFISPANDVPLVNRLDLSGALRYEKYSHYDIATPKLGAVYAPTADFEFRASWGKSFKAPTLFQQYNSSDAYLEAATAYGVTGAPASATVLFISGGNLALKPERATNWTATLAFHPRALEGLEIEASYFNVRYKDRVTTPITYSRQALLDPIYAAYVNSTPSASQAAAWWDMVDNASNFTISPFDPSSVVAIIDNRNTNVTAQKIKGVDLGVKYVQDLGDHGTIAFAINASYLEVRQKISPLAAETELTGNAFSPPNFRLRGGVTWKDDALSVTSFVNHQGSVADRRGTTSIAGKSLTTVDLSVRYQIENGPALFRGLEFILSATNLFDAAPPSLATTQFFQAPYDTTNYSAAGRVVGLSLMKHW